MSTLLLPVLCSLPSRDCKVNIIAEGQRRFLDNQLQTRISREDLVRFLIALGRQIIELGDPNFLETKPELYYIGIAISIPEQFISHEDALLHMEIVLGELFEYIDKADKSAQEGRIPDDVALSLMTEFHAMMRHFEKWKSAFESFSASDSNEFSRETPESMSSTSSAVSSPAREHYRPARSPAFLILKVYYCLTTAFLARIERNDESTFEEYELDFWKALDAAEEFVQCTSTYVNPLDKTSPARSPVDPTSSIPHAQLPPVVRSTFSLALGIVPTLFLVASRASDPTIRDKALMLLRKCNPARRPLGLQSRRQNRGSNHRTARGGQPDAHAA